MRILMIQPNYHAGAAEVAGNWPPGWVAYIGGALKNAGMENVRFIDAMCENIPDDALREIIRKNRPDVVLATAITPMIYIAQRTLQLAKEAVPSAVTVLGGIHPTFMYGQVLQEAPWIDYILRGEGEVVAMSLLRAIENGTDRKERKRIWGIAFLDDDGQVVATPAQPVIEDLGDKDEVRDYSKYNFVTPIMKPEKMTREEVLKGVLRNFARFYMRKSFLEYPWIRDSFKRRYMLGCLKASAKTTVTKKYYDLERLKYKGGPKTEVGLGVDESKVLSAERISQRKRERPQLPADVDFKGAPIKAMACGGSDEQIGEDAAETGATRDRRTARQEIAATSRAQPATAKSS